MANSGLHPGTVKARNTGTVSAASTQFYTVTVHGPDGDFDVPNVRPWMQQWPDDVHVEPYPLSTQVVVIELADQLRFLFPGQTPKRGPC